MSSDYSQLLINQNNPMTIYPGNVDAKSLTASNLTTNNATFNGPNVQLGGSTGMLLPLVWPYSEPSNQSQVLILGGLNPNPPANGPVQIIASQNAWSSISPSETHLGIMLNVGTGQSLALTGMNGRGSNIVGVPNSATFTTTIAGYYRLQAQITVGYAANSATSGLVFYWFTNTPGPQTVLAACYLGAKNTTLVPGSQDYGTAVLLTTVKLAAGQSFYIGYDNPSAATGAVTIQSIWADIQLVDPFSP